MLRVEELPLYEKPTVVFDGYLPFQIQYNSPTTHTLKHWSIANGSDSLLEIAINSKSGNIIRVKLIAISRHDVVFGPMKTISEITSCKTGSIKASLSQINSFYDNYCRETGSLTLYLEKSRATLVIGKPSEKYLAINSDRVTLGLDNEMTLRLIRISNLSSNERATLESTFTEP